MAKIPDSTVLGERPTPRPPSGAPSVNLSSEGGAVGAAGAEFGRTVQGVGDAIVQVSDHLTKARRGAQLTDALGAATAEIGELELSFKNDQDFKTAPDRYTKQAELVRARIEKGIDDKLVRQAFSREFGKLNTAKRLSVLQSAALQETDYHRSTLDTTLDVFAHSAANATNLAEREVVLSQAQLSIESTRSGGWITDVEAGTKERSFLKKVDGSIALRDMAVAPALTANRLGTEPSYLPNLDIEQRERLITAGYRQAEVVVNRERLDAEREAKDAKDVVLTEAFKRLHDKTLDLPYVNSIRNVVDPNDYSALRKSLEKVDKAVVIKDDPAAFARLQSVLYNNADEAPALAFELQAVGKIKNETLSSTLVKARELQRAGGPKTPYERAKAGIMNGLEPSATTMDPAPRARQGLAIIEFDDWFESMRTAKQQPTPDEVSKKASELLRKFALVDMNALAKKTSLGARNDPSQVLNDIRRQAEVLIDQRQKGTLSRVQFNHQMSELNKARLAAEKLLEVKP